MASLTGSFTMHTPRDFPIKSALVSLPAAAIDADRIDYRDSLHSLSLITHSADRIAVDVRDLLDEAVGLAMAKTAELMSGFVGRSPDR
jgi:hypothetical protein